MKNGFVIIYTHLDANIEKLVDYAHIQITRLFKCFLFDWTIQCYNDKKEFVKQ